MPAEPMQADPVRLEDYLDFQGPDAIRLRGHRIDLEHVVGAHKRGQTPEQIADYYESLSLEEIYAVIAYYLRHRDEVDAYIARLDAAEAERLRTYVPSPVMLRIRALLDAQRQMEPSDDETEVSPR